MKAIETTYAGVRFRSRLEARLAVFFDALSIKWEYEPEAFILSDGRGYMPDFWIINDVTAEWNGGGAFVEVKPNEQAPGLDRARLFRSEIYRDHGYNTFVVFGAPSENHGFSMPYCDPEQWIPPYVFGEYDFRRFCAATAAARAHWFWSPAP